MEMFTKIRDFFSKSMESIKELEKELSILQSKFSSGFVSIIGYGGRLKGLPLIYEKKNEKEIKRLSAKLVESLSAMESIKNHQSIENFDIRFTEEILFFRKVTNEVAIIALLPYGNNINKLKEFVKENLSEIISLFQ
ncbi:MAG: hypothetical protein GF317_15410 [Candidatus Lokiarchaeota archaeon]|nr:hypothetical protein [Candidatus Lokiarchaeota archaeon]MBD3200953.1 hypothetical protein [Candidatus Lokiarchaeota archaeon]